MAPLGLSVGGGVRIGNLLGEGDAAGAKRAARAAWIVCVVLVLADTILMMSLSHVWGYIFASDEAIIAAVASNIMAVAVFHVCDAQQVVLQGVLRGIGRQAAGAVINGISYVVCGLPIGYLLSLVLRIGVQGVWFGLAIGATLATIICLMVIARVDWHQASEAARRNAGAVDIHTDVELTKTNRLAAGPSDSSGDTTASEDDAV